MHKVLFISCSVICYALPFTIVPKEGTNLPTSIATNTTTTAYYTIYNNTSSQRDGNYIKYLPPGVTQVVSGGTYSDTCGSTFSLAPNGGSGTIQLEISQSVYSLDSNPQNHLFVSFPGGLTAAGTTFPLNVFSINDYANWANSLPGYYVRQGNAFLMVPSTFPVFLNVFDSCFGNNPASPYIFPQPPIEDSYVDPYYGVPFNTPGPDGATTNIFYRLSDNDAMITIVSYPPLAAYFGYQSYVFTRETSFYVDIPAPAPRKVSPDPSRYEIFGSIGNDVNAVIVQNQYGVPWANRVVVYITTSNSNLANSLIQSAVSYGIDPNAIFVEPIGSNVITGNDAAADDMTTLMRYAVPDSSTAGNNWLNAFSSNVLVYKVSNSSIPVSRYGANAYTQHVVNNSETAFSPSLSTALSQLATLLEVYLTSKQISASESKSVTALSTDSTDGTPETGLVGSYAIANGTLAQGDNQDTSTYAALTLATLGAEETAFIIGVNHNVPGLNNTHYVSIDIYNTSTLTGVAGVSQTNPTAAGFDSGLLTGSVDTVLSLLGITIPGGDTELLANTGNLYITFIARDINNSTIAAASAYGINLQGTSLIPSGDPISIAERSYVVPGRTAGGNVNFMIYPIIVAASADFLP